MTEFLIGHAGIAAAAAFVLYALAIYKAVDIIKQLTEHLERLKPWRVTYAAVIGSVTGPFVYPWIFAITGVPLQVPFIVSIIMGLGTGGVAVNIHTFVEQRLARRQHSERR